MLLQSACRAKRFWVSDIEPTRRVNRDGASSMNRQIPTLGWREWIALPDLNVEAIKVKVDTGARSSALHAENVEVVSGRHGPRVKFQVLPLQKSREPCIACVAKLHDERWVKSSNGKRELRPVIRTDVRWGGVLWEIDLTLTSRDLMGFRMLLGREAVRKRYLVDPGRSFLGGRRKRKGG